MAGRRRLSLLAGLAVLSTLLTPLSQARTGTTTTIKLLLVVTGYTPRDLSPRGPSPGDSIVERDRLYNLVPQLGRPKGALVGTDSAVVTIEVGMQTANWRGVSKLAGGTIAVNGRIPIQSNGRVTLPVVGGSGRFAHARGTLLIRSTDSSHATNVFRLTLP
jgi:hypothetical protein